MAAVIVYLWELTEPHLWHRDTTEYGPEMTIDLTAPWWQIQTTLQQEAAY